MEPALVVLIAVGAALGALALSLFVGHVLALLVEDDEPSFLEIDPCYPDGVVSLPICPRCGHENPADRIRCEECLAHLTTSASEAAPVRRPPSPPADARAQAHAADAPNSQAPRPRYADWWMRWLGYSIIDGLVVVGIALVLSLVLWMMFYASNESPTAEEENTFTGFMALFAYAAAFVYLWVSNSIGQSVGKLILGLRVVMKDTGEAPGPARGFLRTFGYLVSTITLLLGFLWAAWDEDRQAWHYKMAGTVVVSTR